MLLTEAFTIFDDARFGLVSDKTRVAYDQRWRELVRYLGDVDVEGVTVHDLRRYRRHLLERNTRHNRNPFHPTVVGPLSIVTVYGYLKGPKRVFNWLFEEGLITTNPAARLEIPRRPDSEPKAICLADFKKILAAAHRSRLAPRDVAIILILADTGARAGGIAGLRLDDLDLARNRAKVIEKGFSGGKWRFVYFSDYTADAIRTWLDVRPVVSTDALFVSLCAQHSGNEGGGCTSCKKRGKPTTREAIAQLLKRLARRASVTGPHNPHSFRHAAAEQWIRNGADLSRVSRLLGHTTVEITHRFYCRWTDDDLAELHARVSYVADVGEMENSQ